MEKRRRKAWVLARAILGFSGVSLALYVAYRYTVAGNPPEVGTAYSVIFPSSLLLAVLAVLLAFKPFLFRGVDGASGYGLRGGLLLMGAVWMGTGLLCVRSLTQGVIASPLVGTLEFMHMLSHHVVIPMGMGFLLGIPERVVEWTTVGTGTPVGLAVDDGSVDPR